MHHDIYEFKLRQFHGNPNSCKSYFDGCRKYIANVEFTYFDNGIYSKTKCSRDTMNKQI